VGDVTLAWAVYGDGTRDCELCLTRERQPPNRVMVNPHDDPIFKGATPVPLCDPCLRVIHNDATAMIGQMQPYMLKHLGFTDFRIEHGEDITR
jgi:hypothetical protein